MNECSLLLSLIYNYIHCASEGCLDGSRKLIRGVIKRSHPISDDVLCSGVFGLDLRSQSCGIMKRSSMASANRLQGFPLLNI